MPQDNEQQQTSLLSSDDLELQQRVGAVGIYCLPGRSALLFKSRLSIDADGAPNAYHPTDNSRALDNLGNAGHAGNWWGVVTDTDKADGKPVVQKSGDPFPGFYISATSLRDASKARTDPRRYVDSSQVPFIALPAEIVNPHGVHTGDLVAVLRASTEVICYAVYADGGPRGKVGEGSIALAHALGIPSSAKNGGTSQREIIYLVFPGSRVGWPLSVETIAERGQALFEEWGGLDQLRACFDNGDLKSPLDDGADRDLGPREPQPRPTLEELGESEDIEEGQPVVFSVSLTSSLPIDDMVAAVTLASGEQRIIVLRAGQYQGELPAPVIRFQLTAEPAPVGEAELNAAPVTQSAEGVLQGSVLSIEELFENGTEVQGNRLEGQLTWGLHCHTPITIATHAHKDAAATEAPERAVRFGSFEHITCADEVGLDATGRTLSFGGRLAPFKKNTMLPVGPHTLTFGEIVALAGDYYAHLDKQAAQDFKDAWPEPTGAVRALAGDYREPVLWEDRPEVVADILKTTYRDKSASQSKLSEAQTLAQDGLFGHYPVRRYLALASQNFCHFASQPATGVPDDEVNEALRWYRAYHQRALAQAAEAHSQHSESLLFDALMSDAFACHFLTDQFATGHLRVPRRLLGERFGIFRGAQGMAHEMHCEDNKLGLWCTTRLPQSPRVVWRGYGDTMLFTEESRLHFKQVKEAVRRSAAEVFFRACGKSVAALETAEALLPVALRPGEAPLPEDVFPSDEAGQPEGAPNHFPKYCWVKDRDLVARRIGPPEQNAYVDQEGKVKGPFALTFTSAYPTFVV